MKGERIIVPVLVVAAVAAIAVGVYVSMNPVDTTLEFQVRDAVSKNWVYSATFRLENREIRSHFQSDHGPTVQRFTHLKPGKAVLSIGAPGYEPFAKELILKRGRNVLPAPVDLMGVEIPMLKDFIIFEDKEGSDIKCEIQPRSLDGPAVVNHPCMDLWIWARVTAQLKSGIPVQQETEEGSVRGEELFRGRLAWEFDPYPEAIFRYIARIPGAMLKATQAPLWVVDYLIVIPDPRKITREELDKLEEGSQGLEPAKINAYLKPLVEQQKLKVYTYTSWNVKGGAT